MEKLVLGLMGASGSGKGTVVNLVRMIEPKLKLTSLRFSDVLFETLNAWDIPASRENLQKVFNSIENQFGVGSLAKSNLKRIQDASTPLVIIEGVRKRADIDLLRSFPNNLLMYVHTEPHIRYKRLVARNEKVGEAEMTFEQFQKEELYSTETQIASLVPEADVTLTNSGAFTTLEMQVRQFCKEHLQALI